MNCLRNRRSGLTLIELLVVVSIIVIVTAVLAPLLTSTLEGREVREAARQINAYFQVARTRAKQLGRPVGVVIKRSENDPNKAYQLGLAEEVPPYRGFDESSRALVDASTGVATLVVTPGNAPSGFSDRDIQPNDEIRFNFRGARYRILAVNPGTSQVSMEFDNHAKRLPAVNDKHPIPYEVFRRPRMTAATPLDLPTGSALLLGLSGVGLGTGSGVGSARLDESMLSGEGVDRPGYIGLTEFAGISEAALADPPFNAPFNASRMPLAIMFNPTGEVGRIYRFLPPPNVPWPQYRLFPPKRPQDKIYLFLGKDNPAGALPELLDGTNLWVTIDPLSGTVNTASNSPDLQGSEVGLIVSSSRQLAAAGQSVGGR